MWEKWWVKQAYDDKTTKSQNIALSTCQAYNYCTIHKILQFATPDFLRHPLHYMVCVVSMISNGKCRKICRSKFNSSKFRSNSYHNALYHGCVAVDWNGYFHVTSFDEIHAIYYLIRITPFLLSWLKRMITVFGGNILDFLYTLTEAERKYSLNLHENR